ncbi:MAG TPA: basic amino acid ABC transporter substrate-binding protein [Epulopiscium sp.]|nr:basic amino acid ABC transporter substrate-binding protein [Candidatus Epulonipiscium sp.]
MIKKIALGLMTISMVAMTLTGCGAKVDDGSGPIIMGTNAEFAPFEYREGTEIVGFDIEISKKVAEKLGRDLKVEDMEFGGLLAALESGKINFVAAGMTKNPEREKQVDFSNAYYVSNQLITVKADNTDIVTGEDLKGKKIGVQLGTTGETVAREIEGAEVVSFDKGAMALVDLANNKVDAVVLDAEPTKNYTKDNADLKVLDEKLTEEEYSIAVPKGNQELLDAINETLEEIKANGEYDKLIAKYF